MSDIVSLSHKRKENQRQLRKKYLTNDERILELEQDMVRVIDMLMEIENTLHSHASILKTVTKILAEATRHNNSKKSSK